MRLRHKAGWVCLAVGLIALALRLALLPVFPIPNPTFHDEFSYLLGADTFRLGRVANPPHPMWIHFETFHENFQPTYASKYPPAQALAIALGWKLFGHPWYGVWLSCGLMCAALCWMLYGWLPQRYALLGGLMAAAEWGVTGYWVNSYWGGAVAAAAGALVIGAVPRLARRPSAGPAALAALGALVLANSRPYEGALVVAAAMVVLVVWRRRAGRPWSELVQWRVALPVVLVLGSGLAGDLFYNWRVTGNPLLMPYAANQATYGASPAFWMMPLPRDPVYHHEVMRKLWLETDRNVYLRARAFPPFVAALFVVMMPFYLTPVSALAVFSAAFLRHSQKVRTVLALAALPVAGLLLEKFIMVHYFAPAAGLILLLVLMGVQQLRVRFGPRTVGIFAALFFLSVGIQTAALLRDDEHTQFAARRAEMVCTLAAEPGRQLVIVRYTAAHDVNHDWVFNGADIDGSQTVWARDMGDVRNRELIDYFRDRKVWLFEPDLPGARPVAYSPR